MTASVLLALDTTPPVLEVVSDFDVVPPASATLTVRSDEPLGPVSVVLRDALGVSTSLGYLSLDPATLLIEVPTAGVVGPATIRITAADTVLNTTSAEVALPVRGKDTFSVTFALARGYDVTTSMEGAFDPILTMTEGHAVTLTISKES